MLINDQSIPLIQASACSTDALGNRPTPNQPTIMEILLFIAFVLAIIWGLFLWRVTARFRQPGLQWMPVLGAAVVISGSVVGRNFFGIDMGPIPITIDRVLLGGLVVAFAVLVLLGRINIRQFNLTDYAFLALTVLLTSSTLAHDWQFNENMPLSRLLFFNLVPVVVYVLMRHSRVGPREFKVISVMFIGFSIYLAATGIAEWREWQWAIFPRYIFDPSFQEFLGRARGPFLNPVSNGMFLIVGLALLVFAFSRTSSVWTKSFLIATAGLLLAGLFTTLTRSVWFSAILAIGIIVWLSGTRQSRGVMIVVASAGLMLALIGSGDRFLEFKRDKNVTAYEMSQSAKLRPLFAIIAVQMFQDRPVGGCGFGQYSREKYRYLQDPTSEHSLHLTRGYMQHNIFLAYLTETGLVGLVLLLLLILQLAATATRVWLDRSRDIGQRQLGLLMLALLTVHVTNGMFHDVSIAPQINMLLYFVAGMLVSVASHAPATATAPTSLSSSLKSGPSPRKATVEPRIA